jgi:glycerol-3-phosphate dehydrogenase
MFAIPWKGHTLVGTTDTPIEEVSLEPRPLPEEVDFILETAGQYLHRAPSRSDVLSVFVGIRPLANRGDSGNTAALSREHMIRIDNSGLLTIAGGKWTTYRRMAEDCIDQAAVLAELPEKPAVTLHLDIHGFHKKASEFGNFAIYGSDGGAIQELIRQDPSLAEPLHSALPYCAAEVVWAARIEMARNVEDVLARRTRALFLNARAASEMAPQVAAIMARELQYGDGWIRQQVLAFQELARQYMIAS